MKTGGTLTTGPTTRQSVFEPQVGVLGASAGFSAGRGTQPDTSNERMNKKRFMVVDAVSQNTWDPSLTVKFSTVARKIAVRLRGAPFSFASVAYAVRASV